MIYTDLQKECHCSIQYKTNNDKTRDYSLKKKIENGKPPRVRAMYELYYTQ